MGLILIFLTLSYIVMKMALIVIGIIFYLMSYFNVFLECFEVLSDTVFYPVNLFVLSTCFAMLLPIQLFFIFYGILYLSKNVISYHHSVDISKEILTNLPNAKTNMIVCSECRYNCSSHYY